MNYFDLLPDESIVKIVLYLDCHSFNNFRKCCRRFYNILDKKLKKAMVKNNTKRYIKGTKGYFDTCIYRMVKYKYSEYRYLSFITININHMYANRYMNDGKKYILHSSINPACTKITNHTIRGITKSKIWYYKGKVHRDNGPAYNVIFPYGKSKIFPSYISFKNVHNCIAYFKHGVLHRDKYPAVIFKDDLEIYNTYYWIQNGLLHRDNGPAVIDRDGKMWYRHGVLHREDGPAVEYPGKILWYKNGLLHREDGPAVFEHTDQKFLFIWYRNGFRHNENGYAYKDTRSGVQKWYKNGQLHNQRGPAIRGPTVARYENRKRSNLFPIWNDKYMMWFYDDIMFLKLNHRGIRGRNLPLVSRIIIWSGVLVVGCLVYIWGVSDKIFRKLYTRRYSLLNLFTGLFGGIYLLNTNPPDINYPLVTLLTSLHLILQALELCFSTQS